MGFAAQNTPDLNDLEFYISIINCLPQYVNCKNNMQPSNPTIDCLQYAKCKHIGTLEALIQSPYVQANILGYNQQINNSVNDILTKYGKNSLDKVILQYNNANLTNLLNDLIASLEGPDLTALSGTGLYPVPIPD